MANGLKIAPAAVTPQVALNNLDVQTQGPKTLASSTPASNSLKSNGSAAVESALLAQRGLVSPSSAPIAARVNGI